MKTMKLAVHTAIASLALGCAHGGEKSPAPPAKVAAMHPDVSAGRVVLDAPLVAAIRANPHHTRHAELFGKYVSGYNLHVLEGVDKVTASAPDGGGYFIGIKAQPPESPIGYDIALLGNPLLKAPRTTSYCSGSSYSAFIEGLNAMGLPDKLDATHSEAMRMQEPDGGRREDWIKYWGLWNANGFGSHYALVQYSGMGTDVKPEEALPGDFMNISWTSGSGHSVVFLGWTDEDGKKGVAYWSSQGGTNGLGDQISPLSKVQEVKIVRLTAPENLYTFNPATPVKKKVPGDRVEW